jgi:hypothetical protein
MRHTQPSFRQQRGIATLYFAVTMVVLVIGSALLTSKSVFVQQKVSNNNVRSSQAFEAAEAGMAVASLYLANNPDRDGDGIVDPVFDTDADQIGDSTTTAHANGFVTVTVQDLSVGNMRAFRVTSQGFSDDRSANQTIVQSFQRLDPLPNGPRNPLVTRGSMVIDGAATVLNPEGHSTIWSGNDVDLGSNNATATEIADPGQAGYPTCMYTPMTCTTVTTSNRTAVGLDVVEHDSTLAHMTAALLFEGFFGATPTNYRSTYVTLETDSASADDDLHLATNEVVWIEGDADLSAITVGCTVAVVGNNVCANENIEPSIVIINGDLSTQSTPHFYGIVFVMGDVDLSGNVTLDGALIVAGSTNSSSGSFDLTYNSGILDSTRDNGALGTPTGNWHDF